MVLSSGGYPGKLQPNFQIHGKVLFISIFLLGHADIGKLGFLFFFFERRKAYRRPNGGKGTFLSFFVVVVVGSCCLEPVVCPQGLILAGVRGS